MGACRKLTLSSKGREDSNLRLTDFEGWTGAHRLGRVRRIAGMLVGVALAMLAVVGWLPAPASAAEVSRLGYVGRVAGTKAFVGVVVRGSRVTAYVCDGRKLARWFEGTLRGERARLRGRSGGRLTLRIVSARRARGVLRLPGRKRLRFAASAARGRAGLFRDERTVTRSGRPRRALTGWVRLNNGRVRGATATSRYRIEHPSRGITVALDAAAGGTISSPSSAPKRAQRVTGTPVPICRWFVGATTNTRRPLTTPGCGIPRAGIVPSRPTGPSVLSRPPDFPLSQDALAFFADRIDDQVVRRRNEVLRKAGRSDPGAISESARAKIATRAGAMLNDSRLLSAAESLRRGTPSEVIARTEAYANQARPQLDKVRGLMPSDDPLVAVVAMDTVRQVSLPQRRTYVGPWAEISNVVTEGDDWEFDENSFEICGGDVSCLPFLNIAFAATRVAAHVRAGFNSSISWDRAHLLAFDIPANAGLVQVEVDVTQEDLDVETEVCFGNPDGSAQSQLTIHEVGGDGVVDPFNDPIVTGFYWQEYWDEDDLGLTEDDCVPSLAPPIPDPPPLNIVGGREKLLEFTAPPEGGSYVLSVSVQAHAEVLLGGTAVSQAQLGIDSVTVSHG